MDLPILRDLFAVLVVGALAGYGFERLGLPSLVGYLATGLLLGPRGLAVVADAHAIELLAEIGVIALLFTIGVEISLPDLGRLWREVLVGGGLQVTLTGAAVGALAFAAGYAPPVAAFAGGVVAMSSTAIVMRLLAERAEVATPHGNLALGILVFQDLMVVPMVLLVPILAGRGGGWADVARTMGLAAAVVAATLVVSRRVVPPLLARVVRTRSRELFLLTVLSICLGTAWVTSIAGLSLGLGAFLAGLVVSESEYGHHALGATTPFRDAFSALFFVSVGMLLDVAFVAEHVPLVVGVTAVVLVTKTVVVWALVTYALGYPGRVGLLAGLLLSQVGEFSFLLIHAGARAELIEADTWALLIAATGLSMAFAPVVLRAAPGLSQWGAELARGAAAAGAVPDDDPGEVLIIGQGVNGRNVARALRYCGIGYSILELNPRTVRELAAKGEPIRYGDAASAEGLAHAGIARVKVVVVTVPEVVVARRIVSLARDANAAARIVVRTRFTAEVAALRRVGASEVVPEEFETSIEILSRVLRDLLVPTDTIEAVAREIRAEDYERLRAAPDVLRPALADLAGASLGGLNVASLRVGRASPLDGVLLKDARLREDVGVTVVACVRAGATVPNPPADWRFAADDVVWVLGADEALAGAPMRFAAPASDPGRTRRVTRGIRRDVGSA